MLLSLFLEVYQGKVGWSKKERTARRTSFGCRLTSKSTLISIETGNSGWMRLNCFYLLLLCLAAFAAANTEIRVFTQGDPTFSTLDESNNSTESL